MVTSRNKYCNNSVNGVDIYFRTKLESNITMTRFELLNCWHGARLLFQFKFLIFGCLKDGISLE